LLAFLREVAVVEVARDVLEPLRREPGFSEGVLLVTNLLAEERRDDLLVEPLFKKVLPGLSMVFFASAARAALAAVGRLKRDAAES
jgi:hypothetical protein